MSNENPIKPPPFNLGWQEVGPKQWLATHFPFMNMMVVYGQIGDKQTGLLDASGSKPIGKVGWLSIVNGNPLAGMAHQRETQAMAEIEAFAYDAVRTFALLFQSVGMGAMPNSAAELDVLLSVARNASPAPVKSEG